MQAETPPQPDAASVATVRQVVTLGDPVGRVERLEIRCTRCPRQGRVKPSELIAAHGAGMDPPQLGTVLAADRPKPRQPARRTGAS
jgi:hypothetical protein